MSYQLGSVDSNQRAEVFAEHRNKERRPRSRKLLAAAVAVFVMALFAGGLWFAYEQGARHAGGDAGSRDVPLIRADESPTKVRPEKPGGMEIPDRDKLIYTQKRAAVEHLLPPPEKPMSRPSVSTTPAQPEAPAPAAEITSGPTAAGVPASAPSIVPPPQQQPSATPSGKISAAPAIPAKPAAASSPTTRTGGTRLQLGSVRSEGAARQEWDRIKRANSDLLGGLTAAPIRADLADKGVFYRIQTGPIADADRVCDELKRRNIGCIIAR